jgi:hypothetical protein
MTTTSTDVSHDAMQIVDRAAQVGLSPHEWLSLCTCNQASASAPVPPSPEEWREAILSTVPGEDLR